MNSITQSIIEHNIDLIDSDLGLFIYSMSMDLTYSDFNDVIATLEDAQLDVFNARLDALHHHINHAAYWFKNNHLSKMSIHEWIANSLPHFIGFTVDEIENYIVLHKDKFKKWVLISKESPSLPYTVEVAK